MNSSFPNRWSFSYLKFTKYVTNIIAEPRLIEILFIDRLAIYVKNLHTWYPIIGSIWFGIWKGLTQWVRSDSELSLRLLKLLPEANENDFELCEKFIWSHVIQFHENEVSFKRFLYVSSPMTWHWMWNQVWQVRSPRTIWVWNRLPATVDEDPSLASFKRELSNLTF